MSGMAGAREALVDRIARFLETNYPCACGEESCSEEPEATAIVELMEAAGFGPVKGEKRLMELAALMAYDAVEEGALREAKAVALEEAADAIEPRVMQFFKVTQDLNDPHRAWLRARAAAVRGEA